MVMPKEQQKKICRTVCNIPVNGDTVCKTLPRPPESSGIIMLKLKRKLKYCGHQYYESAHPAIVHAALNYLKNNNQLYQDVNIAVTNIDNELVSFENTSNDSHEQLSQINSLHETSHDNEFLDNQECRFRLSTPTQDHAGLSSSCLLSDTGNMENMNHVESDDEENDNPQNDYRSSTN